MPHLPSIVGVVFGMFVGVASVEVYVYLFLYGGEGSETELLLHLER